MKIEKLKEFESEYKGEKMIKYYVEFDGGKRGYASKGKWNSGWNPGQDVEAKITKLDRPAKDGGDQYKINCPDHLMPRNNNAPDMSEPTRTIQLWLKRAKEEIQFMLTKQDEQLKVVIAMLNGKAPKHDELIPPGIESESEYEEREQRTRGSSDYIPF